jgi:DNA-binding LacI/PurR family transcriptional regulator
MARPVGARPAGRAAPTLESVAERAGVSRATAGRVLSGSTTVGEQAREAVLRAAAELSYVTNRAARSLMTRRSDSIAFVVAEEENRFFDDPYFALLLRGAHTAIARRDVQLVFSVLSGAEARDRFERFARGGHLDGVIVVSLHGDDPLPRRLLAAGIPVVLSGRPYTPVEGLTYVDAGNTDGARTAVTRLAERGRTRLATITGPMDMVAAIDRRDGFEAELAARGLVGHGVADGDFSIVGGRAAMARLLAAAPDIDGVFAANDLMAVGAMQALAESGRRVPEDVAVVGFDDSPLAAVTNPAVTTVRQPIEAMGTALAALLLETIEQGEAPEPVIVDTELVPRTSG